MSCRRRARGIARLGVASALFAGVAVTMLVLTAGPAASDPVVLGCTIVSNPTPDDHTSCPGADLSGVALSSYDLSYADLSGANLSGATLINMTLTAADLSGADLSSSSIRQTDMSATNLSGADFTRANLPNTNLTGADLADTNFTSATLSSDFLRSTFWGTNPPTMSGALLNGATMSDLDLRELDLTGVDLAGADLTDADLNGGMLTGANLSGAGLSGADLSGANLESASLSSASLAGATLSGADTSRTALDHANLTSVVGLTDTQLQESGGPTGLDLTGTDLSGLDLSGFDLSRLILDSADLSGANLDHADLSLVDLDTADLSGASLQDATLASAVLDQTRLTHAVLSGADLSGASVAGATLSYADLSGANLSRAQFTGVALDHADLSEVTGLTSQDLSRAGVGSFGSGPDLRGVDLSGDSLHSFDLSFAHLGDADLSGADLSDASLAGADITGATIGYDVGSGGATDLSGAQLDGTVGLTTADLRAASSVTGIDVSDDDLRQLDLSGLDLSGADLSFATVDGVDLRNADFTGANFDGASFAGSIWGNTICPDGTISDDHPDGTCLPLAPTVTADLSDQVVNAGEQVTLSASAIGSPGPQAEFQVSTDGGVTWSAMEGGGRSSDGLHTTATATFVAIPSQDGNEYRAEFSNEVGSTTTRAATLTVHYVEVTSGEGTTFVEGQSGGFTVTTAADPTPAAIAEAGVLPAGVSFADNGDGTGTFSGSADPGTAGTYPLTLTASNGVAPDATQSFSLTVASVPEITSDPSDLTVNVGDQASFTAAASGFPDPSPRWQVSSDGGTTWSDLAGATSATYAFTADASQDGNEYRAVFSNVAGQAFTDPARLTVNYVSFSSADATTFVEGVPGTFQITTAAEPPATTVGVSGALPQGLSYVDNGDGTGTISGTPAAGTRGTYAVSLTASNGVAPPTTQDFTLTVDAVPAITLDPTDMTVDAGQQASFFATASGFPAPDPQWQVSTDGGGTWSDVAGATSATYAFTAGPSQNGNEYRVVFANLAGRATSDEATLTVDSEPTVSADPVDQIVAPTTQASFTAAADGFPAPTVQWQQSKDGGSTWKKIPGATTGTYAVIATQAKSGWMFRAVFTNELGSATSGVATLTVGTRPRVTSNPAPQRVANGDVASFTSLASGTPTPSVQWQQSADGGVTWSDVAGATSTTYSFPAASPQNGYRYRALFTNSLGSATSRSAALHVRSGPRITEQPQDVTGVTGTTVYMTALAKGDDSMVVVWYASTDGGQTWQRLDAGSRQTTINIYACDPPDVAHYCDDSPGYENDGAEYRATFTDASGSTTTAAATLHVTYQGRMTFPGAGDALAQGAQTSVEFTLNSPGPVAIDGARAQQLASDGDVRVQLWSSQQGGVLATSVACTYNGTTFTCGLNVPTGLVSGATYYLAAQLRLGTGGYVLYVPVQGSDPQPVIAG